MHDPAVPFFDDDELISPAAERMRRLRARKRDGGACFRGELSGETVQGLIDAGWLGKGETENPLAVGAALENMADCYCRGTLYPPIIKPDDGA